jgi:glycosyltransferase involved in cell wall biosynthesis
LRILACAYACNPCLGSEEGVGWGWVTNIAQTHEVWVLTDPRHRGDIERTIDREPDRRRNLHFVYVRRYRWRRLEAVWPPAYLATYRIWQQHAFVAASALQREVKFDLVHTITYVGFRVPGPFFRLGIPLVWGPIGGLENTPWRFLPKLGLNGGLYYACRNLVNSWHKRFLRLPVEAFQAADGGVIAATTSIQRELKRCYGRDSTVICEIGWPAETTQSHSLRTSKEPLRISWSGQHLPGKALPLLLQALARLPLSVDWRLSILGEGPCTAKWKRRARRLNIGQNCEWHGHLSRIEALNIVHDSHLFVTTSLKDLTSTVIVEALVQGVPVLCPDHCGFSDAIDETCGIKLPVRNLRKFVTALAEAIALLYEKESLRRCLALGALTRASKFSWDNKGVRLNEIYRRQKAKHAPAAQVATEFNNNQRIMANAGAKDSRDAGLFA